MLPLIPIIANFLLENGLGSIANAAAKEGMDWVKEKTGVDLSSITDKGLSEDAMLKLKQFQLEHEDALRKYDLEDRKMDLQFFAAEVDDRKSARDRASEFLKAGKVNWQGVALVIICVVFIGFGFYVTVSDANLNEWAKGSVTLLLGRFLGYLDAIYAFEYGTTRNNRRKDETIANLSK